jgi:poly(ADP-ribose) glycohydrolase
MTDTTFVTSDLAARLVELSARDFGALERFLLDSAKRANPRRHEGRLVSLCEAIQRFDAFVRTQEPSFHFYEALLPKIRAWAMDTAVHGPIPLSRSSEPSRIELSQRRVRHLLAAAFFLGTTEVETGGSLSFWDIYRKPVSEAVERVLCLLAYFYQADRAGEEPTIAFSRFVLTPDATPAWDTITTRVVASRVNLHTDRMEDAEAPVFVDFANRDLHIHCVAPSLTQEEVLFSMCPESFVGILFCERLLPTEVLTICGVRRFCEYSGYLSSFRFTGFHPTQPTLEILVADAVRSGQFSDANIRRDLNKIYLGFRSCKGTRVSTGHWGCGAFGGDRTLKFLQQVCAATVADVLLDYSTFRDEESAHSLRTVLAQAERGGFSVADLVGVMHRYGAGVTQTSFHEHVMRALTT